MRQGWTNPGAETRLSRRGQSRGTRTACVRLASIESEGGGASCVDGVLPSRRSSCWPFAASWGWAALSVRLNVRLGRADTAWRLTYFTGFEARQALATLRVASPADTRHCRVIRQDFRQANLRIDSDRRSSSQVREIVALAQGPGPCESTLLFDLHLNSRADWVANDAAVTLTANERAKYLRATPEIQADNESVSRTLTELRPQAADQAALIHSVFEYCRQIAAVGADDAADDAVTVFEAGSGTPLGCAGPIAPNPPPKFRHARWRASSLTSPITPP